MATESGRDGNRDRSRQAEALELKGARSFSRQDERLIHAARRATKVTFKGALEDLAAARSAVEALESRPRARCRVSQVQTTLGSLITSADEVLGLLLQRPPRTFVGMPLANLIAGPERKIFSERARALMEGAEGVEWETRLAAPGARIAVPVAITLERGQDGTLNWYIRDLTELRRAQSRVMELEQLASSL